MSASAGKDETNCKPAGDSCPCAGGYMSKKAQFAELLEMARGHSRKNHPITKRQQADLIKAMGDPAIPATERLRRARAAVGWDPAPCGGQGCAGGKARDRR